MNLRLLELDHRTAGVGEIVQFRIQGIGDCEDPVFERFVVFVLHGKGDQFGSDGPEFDRLLGHALRHLPHRGVLQFAARHRPRDPGHHPRFQVIMQDVTRRKHEAALARRSRLRILVEAAHVARRIVRPTLAADVGIEMGITVGDDVEPGELLFVQIDRNRIDILFAELVVDHRVEKTSRAEILRVPARPRQRAGNRGRQHDVFGGAKHNGYLPEAKAEPLTSSLSLRRS
jgi:hypothetical protein